MKSPALYYVRSVYEEPRANLPWRQCQGTPGPVRSNKHPSSCLATTLAKHNYCLWEDLRWTSKRQEKTRLRVNELRDPHHTAIYSVDFKSRSPPGLVCSDLTSQLLTNHNPCQAGPQATSLGPRLCLRSFSFLRPRRARMAQHSLHCA